VARVKYEAGEMDPNHRVIKGIRATLATSHTKRARTALQAVDMIDLDDDGVTATLDQKVEHICKTLACTHERDGDEIIFMQ